MARKIKHVATWLSIDTIEHIKQVVKEPSLK